MWVVQQELLVLWLSSRYEAMCVSVMILLGCGFGLQHDAVGAAAKAV